MKHLPLLLSLLSLSLALYVLLRPQEPVVVPQTAITDLPADPTLPEPQAFTTARSWDIPDTLSFANEPVPLNRTDIREMFDRELHINTYWHNNTIFLLKRANRWLPQMRPILEKYGVPEDFLYLSVIESSLTNAVSPSDAVGFWQFLDGTAKDFGLEVDKDVDERYHPLKATEAAAKYLLKAYQKFGNWTNVAASYNRGMSGLDRDLERQQVESYYDALLNQETSRYLFRILAIKTIFADPSKYGFDIKKEHLYEPEPLKYITVTESIDDLTVWAQQQGTTLLMLKRHNPWLRTNSLKVKNGRSYEIGLPM